MGKRKNNVDDNQVNLNNICDEQPCKTKNNEKSENKNNTNDTNYDNINYKEEIIKLNNKVNQLANIINSLQDNLENILSESIDKKLKEKEKSEQETKKLVDTELFENTEQYSPDMIFETVDEKTGKKSKVILDVKMKNSNDTKNDTLFNKYDVVYNKQNTNKSRGYGAVLGSILGTTIAPGFGTLLGGTIGGMASIINSKNKDIDKESNTITREFLISNPIQSHEEFVERMFKIFPNRSKKDLLDNLIALNYKKDSLQFLNEMLIEFYDKNIEIEKEIDEEYSKHLIDKDINENFKPKIQYAVPYINVDFEEYKLTNNLRQIMKDRDISQEKMAEIIGVSRSSLINLLNNRGTTLENAFKLSIALGLPITDIFTFNYPEEEIWEDEEE